MKIEPRRADAFSKAPDEAVRAILFYGPDGGLVSERAKNALKAFADDPDDPFAIVQMTGKDLDDDGARLNDEAAAITFGGGRRVILVSDVGDKQEPVFADFLEHLPGDAAVLVEAGDLPARAKLRKLFEGAKAGAAVACYRDEGASLKQTIAESLKAEGLTISRDALAYLEANLGSDRLLTRRELEKLALYMGPADRRESNEVTLADVQANVGDSAFLTLEDLAYAVGGGQLAEVERGFARALAEGINPVGVLRSVSNHFLRLHLVAGHGDKSKAIAALRPPLFWKVKERFAAQANSWRPQQLAQALGLLLEAEADCKKTGAADEALASRTLLRLAMQSPMRRR